MWFNNVMSALNQTTLKMPTLNSLLGGEVGREITLVNELHEWCILEDLHFFPDRTRDRQGKEQLDVLAQPLWSLKEARTDRVVRAAQMQDDENDELFLLGRYLHFHQAGIGIEDTSQLRLRVYPFPQVAMLLGQLNEILNAASTDLEQECNAHQEETGSNRACLSERKPILADPLRKGHDFIISNPAPVSSL